MGADRVMWLCAQGTWIPNKLSLQMMVDARAKKTGKVLTKVKVKVKTEVNGHGPVAVVAH